MKTDRWNVRSWATTLLLIGPLMLAAFEVEATAEGRKVLARGAESYGPVTPIETQALGDLIQAPTWQPGDPTKEVPRRTYAAPGQETHVPDYPGRRDPLADLQAQRVQSGERVPTITTLLNFDGQPFSGSTPPDTIGDVGPDHYVQAVNSSFIAIYDKTGTMLPGYPIALESLAPSGGCTSGFGDPIVLYDWLADRWFLQEFTSGGLLCIYVSTTPDPTGTYSFYEFSPPSFPDYPHYGVWPDAYYAATNEDGAAGNQTTYAFDRTAMLAGAPATMQRLAVVPPVPSYNFQTLTPADHDGDTAPPAGSPGIFMRHFDDEAHAGSPVAETDVLQMWEMDVDFATPANTTLTELPAITITDFNSWMVNYTTFFSTPQPGSGTLLDPIREAILQRLVYRNFGSHETLLGVMATNRDPATSGSVVQQGNRWFELRRSAAEGGWSLFQEGTFGGDTNSPDANFFMGSVAMDGAGNIALGYSKTDVGASSIFPSLGFTGRLATDPPGTMGPENDIVLGTQASTAGRWGDYANMSVDPADDCTFWFTGEYIPGGSWGTRINSFVFEECQFGFFMAPTPGSLDVCAPTDPDPVVDIDVTSVGGWSFATTLVASGEPPGTTSTLVPNGQVPDFVSTYTLMGTDSSTTGTYSISITGTGADAPPTVRNTQIVLNLAVAEPAMPSLEAPADGAGGVGLLPTLSWDEASNAVSYDLEVASDPGFGTIVYSATGLTDLSHTLSTALDPNTLYYWRVTANNVCGTATSEVFAFRTVILICTVFDSTDVPQAIPDSGPVSSNLTVDVADGGTIADVNVLNLTGTHTFMGDLDFNVESPEGTAVMIMGRRCGTNEDFDLNLDDEAAPGDWPCPPTDGGTYQPTEALAGFDGEDSAGSWTLTINDNAGNDSGQLDSWSLEICTELDGLFVDSFESGDTSAWSSTEP
ncbi:MAG: proprotein convertase P-domain-containing protein [Acidobacteriota bacterium]